MPPSEQPTFDDIERAAQQIAGVAHRTPVVTSRTIDARTGAQVFFKCELFQRAGAFKFRGAYNALSRLSPAERRRGVVTYSSGNHAQAIALAGQLLDIPRTIVMPKDAPAVKREATAGYGAEIVLYDPRDEQSGGRESIGRRLAEERGLALIPPFDHPHVIAGQGTAVRELIEEVGPLDLLLVPCGGGGLLSGSALSARALSPWCRIIGIEPAGGDDGARSFRTKTLQRVEHPDTIADGARTPSLGALTFPMILDLVDDIVTVDDGRVACAMFYLWERLKLVVEPTGALGAAALLEGASGSTGPLEIAGRRVGVVLSGGNADLSQVAAWQRLVIAASRSRD